MQSRFSVPLTDAELIGGRTRPRIIVRGCRRRQPVCLFSSRNRSRGINPLFGHTCVKLRFSENDATELLSRIRFRVAACTNKPSYTIKKICDLCRLKKSYPSPPVKQIGRCRIIDCFSCRIIDRFACRIFCAGCCCWRSILG
jgi:hypothetical protein